MPWEPGQSGNPDGNPKGKPWAGMIRRAVYEAGKDREKLYELAQALILKAMEGDVSALKEIGDRIDGKVPQGLEHAGPEGGPIQAKVTVEFVGANPGGVPLPVATPR